MSKLSKFLGASKAVEIRGETLKLFSLTVAQMNLIDRMAQYEEKESLTKEDQEEMDKIAKEIIKASFKEENFTDEEINSMDLDLYSEVYACIMQNIYDTKDGKGLNRIRELKEKISKQRQSENN